METNRKKVLLVGDDGTCKSSFLLSLKNGPITTPHLPKIADDVLTDVDYKGRRCGLRIVDTANLGDFDQLRFASYADADVILVFFNINSLNTLFNIVDIWDREINRFRPNKPVILVGNKCELRADENDETSPDKKKYISFEEIRIIAEQVGAFAYLECSAKTKEGVKEVLQTAAHAANFLEPEPADTAKYSVHDRKTKLLQTPPIARVRRVMQSFHVQSPSDAVMSPCTATIVGRGGMIGSRPQASTRRRNGRQVEQKLNFEDMTED